MSAFGDRHISSNSLYWRYRERFRAVKYSSKKLSMYLSCRESARKNADDDGADATLVVFDKIVIHIDKV